MIIATIRYGYRVNQKCAIFLLALSCALVLFKPSSAYVGILHNYPSRTIAKTLYDTKSVHQSCYRFADVIFPDEG